VQLFNVPCPGQRQSMERAVFLLKNVFSEIIAEGMEEAFYRIGLIVTAFVFIASVAALDEIGYHIRTALRTRLKVINREFCAAVYFADTAVSAAEIVASPQGCTLCRSYHPATSASACAAWARSCSSSVFSASRSVRN
jgi:hypothetical protein